MIKKLTLLGAACTFSVALAAHRAEAAPILRLSSGPDTVTVADGAALDANPAAGAVTYIGAVGSFSLNVSTGISYPIIGEPLAPRMDLNSVNTSSLSAGTLTIEFTDTDFAPAGPPGFMALLGGTTDGSVALAAYRDLANGAFAHAEAIASLSPLGPGAFSGSMGSAVAPALSPYSLTVVATISHSRGSEVSSFNAELSAVPEPASLALLGIGCGLAGGLCRRRRKNG